MYAERRNEMEILKFVLAFSPVLVVLLGILVFKKPAMKVAPVALIWTVFLAFTYFNAKGLAPVENIGIIDGFLWKGIKEGLKIVGMVFSAFVTLNMLKSTGAMEDVKHTVTKFSGSDRRVQLMVIGFLVPIFLEGAAGAGAPAAIAAPFLVALGFNPVTAIAIALMGDATPVSFGGAGLTTIIGGKGLVDAGLSTTALNSAMVGRFHMFGVLIIPFLVIAIAFGKKGFKGIVPYLIYVGTTTCLLMFLLSNFVGPEVTSLGTGLISIFLSIAYVKFIKIKTPDEYKYHSDSEYKNKYGPIRALSPYIAMLVLLPAVRYGVPALWPKNGFAVMCTFGYIVWVDIVIFICAIIGAFCLGLKAVEFQRVCGNTMKSVMPVLMTMGSLLVVAYIMQSENTGMMPLIANDIARIAQGVYPAAAVLIGSMGSFVTGTGLGSNIMFSGLHVQAAQGLGINPVVVFA